MADTRAILKCLSMALLVAGCTSMIYGEVVDTVASETVRVGGLRQKLEVGDRVSFYEESCLEGNAPSTLRCVQSRVGTGTVIAAATFGKFDVKVDANPSKKIGPGTLVDRSD